MANTKRAAKQAPKPAAKRSTSKPAQAMPTAQTLPATAPAPAPASVALRGGQAVTSIALSGTPYRTGAAHNAQWWATLTTALAQGPKPVAGLLLTPANPNGVPAHFVGYTLRRGYLKAV